MEQLTSLIGAVSELLAVLTWPAVVVFILIRFGPDLREFFGGLSEFTLKASGVGAVAKERVEAAVALGAATAMKPNQQSIAAEDFAEEAKEIAGIVSHVITPRMFRRTQIATVLWVDDVPANNTTLCQSLEALGIRIILATSTEDALSRIQHRKFDAIISDMGRPPDPRAGYALLDDLRRRGEQTPYIIYATGAGLPENQAEARQRGAFGSTNRAHEVFQLVPEAIGLGGVITGTRA